MKYKLAIGRIYFTTGEPKANKGEIPGTARVFKEYYVSWCNSVIIVINTFMPTESGTARAFSPKYNGRFARSSYREDYAY